MRISSYGCTLEVLRALKKLELLSAVPRETLTHLSRSLNFPLESITRHIRTLSMKISQFILIMDLDYISLQVVSFVGAVLLVTCTVSVSLFGSVMVCVFQVMN